MEIQNLLIEIKTLLQSYLDKKVSDKELVKQYDKILVRDDIDWDSSNTQLELIDEFQEELALYVEKPEWRKEHRSYFGDLELSQKIKEFLQKIK